MIFDYYDLEYIRRYEGQEKTEESVKKCVAALVSSGYVDPPTVTLITYRNFWEVFFMGEELVRVMTKDLGVKEGSLTLHQARLLFLPSGHLLKAREVISQVARVADEDTVKVMLECFSEYSEVIHRGSKQLTFRKVKSLPLLCVDDVAKGLGNLLSMRNAVAYFARREYDTEKYESWNALLREHYSVSGSEGNRSNIAYNNFAEDRELSERLSSTSDTLLYRLALILNRESLKNWESSRPQDYKKMTNRLAKMVSASLQSEQGVLDTHQYDTLLVRSLLSDRMKVGDTHSANMLLGLKSDEGVEFTDMITSKKEEDTYTRLLVSSAVSSKDLKLLNRVVKTLKGRESDASLSKIIVTEAGRVGDPEYFRRIVDDKDIDVLSHVDSDNLLYAVCAIPDMSLFNEYSRKADKTLLVGCLRRLRSIDGDPGYYDYYLRLHEKIRGMTDLHHKDYRSALLVLYPFTDNVKLLRIYTKYAQAPMEASFPYFSKIPEGLFVTEKKHYVSFNREKVIWTLERCTNRVRDAILTLVAKDVNGDHHVVHSILASVLKGLREDEDKEDALTAMKDAADSVNNHLISWKVESLYKK